MDEEVSNIPITASHERLHNESIKNRYFLPQVKGAPVNQKDSSIFYVCYVSSFVSQFQVSARETEVTTASKVTL